MNDTRSRNKTIVIVIRCRFDMSKFRCFYFCLHFSKAFKKSAQLEKKF